MTIALPDVSVTEKASSQIALDWVGMEGIDLPVTLVEPGYRRELSATADLQVDLPDPTIKGIHMSRLYGLLERVSEGQALTPVALKALLADMIASHADCGSQHARLRLQFKLMAKRPALKTPALAGYKAYPVTLEARLIKGVFSLTAQVQVTYSSTCPCSAALSRQLIEQAFIDSFGDYASLTPAEVAIWLRSRATLATPHSQRSLATVTVPVVEGVDDFGLLALINRIEGALATPVQTAVKRADEQAFAALNGQNLMFVEDAARLIKGYLNEQAVVHVQHLESLHPHDATAWAGSVL